jgi:hypothetical protein
MRRVFAIDVLACFHCGGRRRLIALITDLFQGLRQPDERETPHA